MTEPTLTETSASNDAERREALRQKIEASEQRNAGRSFADQAKDAADSAVEYAKANPLKVVAGGIALGLAIGAMTRPGRRVTKRGGALAAIAADAAIAYGLKAFDKAGTLANAATHEAGDAARRIGGEASYRLDVASDALAEGSRRAGLAGRNAMRDLRSRFTH